MNDDLCQKFDLLRMHLPDELTENAKLNFNDDLDFKKYCPENSSGKNECNNNFDKIKAGFLCYKLNQITGHDSTTINDFYTKHVINSGKYKKFISDSSKFTELKEFIDKRNDFMNINIEYMSKFYDAFKLLCNMYGNVATNTNGATLSNNATNFVNTYTELNNYNGEGTAYRQILSSLSTDYDNIKKKCSNIPSLPDIKTTQNATKSPEKVSATISVTNSVQTSSQTSRVTSSSPIGNKLFTILSVFGAIAFLLGISYKYSLFGFRKRSQKQYLREKI